MDEYANENGIVGVIFIFDSFLLIIIDLHLTLIGLVHCPLTQLITNEDVLKPPTYIIKTKLGEKVMDLMWPINQLHFHVSHLCSLTMNFIHCHSCALFAMKSMRIGNNKVNSS